MKNKASKIVLVSVFTLFSFGTPAFAEFFTVTAGLPVSYTVSSPELSTKAKPNGFSNTSIESDGGPTGVMLAINPPLFGNIGLGVDLITQKTKVKTSVLGIPAEPFESEFKHTAYHIHYVLPIPIVRLVAGVGLVETGFEYEGTKGTTTGSMFMLSGGFSIFPAVGLNLEYRYISQYKLDLGDSEFEASGSAFGVSTTIGF